MVGVMPDLPLEIVQVSEILCIERNILKSAILCTNCPSKVKEKSIFSNEN